MFSGCYATRLVTYMLLPRVACVVIPEFGWGWVANYYLEREEERVASIVRGIGVVDKVGPAYLSQLTEVEGNQKSQTM